MPVNIRDTFPLTHEHAVSTLVDAEWTREDRVKLMEATSIELHHTVGTALRTHWYLNERTSPLSRHYQRRFGLGYADDMSRLILRQFISELRCVSYDLQAEVDTLLKHWIMRGVNPLTLDRIA